MLRWHSFSSLISRRHSQTQSQRHCLAHTSFFMHGDRRVYSVPRFLPGTDPFIGHPSRNGKMPVYRVPWICSPIHRDATTSMARGPFSKPPYPSFFGIAKRRTSSRYQSKWRGQWRLIVEIRNVAMKKIVFLQFGIITIGDGKIHFYWFAFLNSTVVEIWECSKVKRTYHRW